MKFFQLLRIKDWIKNLFMFLPVFFAGEITDFGKLSQLLLGAFAFSLVASSIYILNDYIDVEDDSRHPVKKNRPLASKKISNLTAILIACISLIAGVIISLSIGFPFLYVVCLYIVLMLAYCLGLKAIPVLDIIILSIGFVLRIKAGAAITATHLSQWIIIMVFLLALFLVVGKRRDDLVIGESSGIEMRKSIKGYNLEFLNILLALLSALIIVAYFMYTMSPDVITRLGTPDLYYTCLFVIAGIARYLQIIYISKESGSPTNVLYKDKFIQILIFLWGSCYELILYFK